MIPEWWPSPLEGFGSGGTGLLEGEVVVRGRTVCSLGERTRLSCTGEYELRSGFASKMRRKRQSSGCFNGRLGRFKRFSEHFSNALCACILDSDISRSMSSKEIASQRNRFDELSASTGHSWFHLLFQELPA